MSYQDLSFAACSSRENGEIEASSRSQRETAEKKAKRRPAAATGALRPVAAAPTLSDARVDEHWKAVSSFTTEDEPGVCVCMSRPRGEGFGASRVIILVFV